MEHYAGIDVSLERSSVCVVDGQGKIVKEAKISSEPAAPIPRRPSALWVQLDSRDQARRLPAHGPARLGRHPADHAQGKQLDHPLPAGG
jgi:predicted NBD/HSP70 family sugar kinase